MAGTGEADEHRLTERVRQTPRRDVTGEGHDDDGDVSDRAPEEDELAAVARLMGFLRQDEDDQ
ncbi:MAG TPA: hypothetical protein VFI47_11395 [Acidimicrobiales bacterium]|nr:hypothetical protein [Acidimicrobiales bacterium]